MRTAESWAAPARTGAQRRRQRGAGLVMIIGVVAALAISAATLVVFTGNVQSNSADTRAHVKSFTVCEAGLDAGMALLAQRWPVSNASIPTFDTAGFRARFSTAEFPNPKTGAFISVTWYDDRDRENPPRPVDTSVRWDQNGNGKLWMVSQAGVGPRATRVISLVERTWLTMGFPRGIPLWAAGNLLSNGQGNNPKIRVEVPPPSGTVTTVHVGGTIEELSVTQAGIARLTGGAIAPIDEVFPPSLRDSLVDTAQANGRYFTSLAAAESSPVNAVWSPQGGLSGLTVIRPAAVTTLRVNGNTDLNSEAQPGILMVLGGSSLEWGGRAQFYGVVYCEGAVATAHGTADFHGMVISTSTADMRGTPNVLYNDRCVANLDQRFPALVRRVQNTWRELRPV